MVLLLNGPRPRTASFLPELRTSQLYGARLPVSLGPMGRAHVGDLESARLLV